MYQFTDDCMIGIKEIDDEHQNLFQMIDRTNDLLHTSTNLRLTAKSLLAELLDYTKVHFNHEESYMEEINDPELPRQQKAHQAFVQRVKSFNIDALNDDELSASLMELMEFLSRWLFQHILGSDIHIGQFESAFAFTSKYITGIDSIDDEHKKLFSIISDANDLIHTELLHDKYDKILDILKELKDYTVFHFKDEEDYMEQINYPDLPAQQAAHTGFVDKLNELNLDDLDDNQQEYLEDLIHFLLNWLTIHILQMDKKIGEFSKQS